MKIKKLFVLLILVAMLVSVVPTGAQDDIELSYFVTDDASYAAIILEGWVAQGSRDEALWIASSAETLDIVTSADDETIIPSGEYAILAFAGPMDDADNWDALAFLTEVIASVEPSERETVISEAYEMEYGNRTFARIDAINDATEAIALAYEIAPATWAVAILYSAPGEGAETSELGFALVDAIAYSLPLEDTIEGDFGSNYLVPSGWVGGVFEGVIDVASSQEALDAEDLEAGQYRIILLDWYGQSAEDTANTLVTDALEEGEYATDPIWLTVGEQEVLQMAVRDADDMGLGGILVMKGSDGGPDKVAIYVSAPGEAQQIGLTALNMLLNSAVPSETE